jgi:hypothetical protein
MGQEIKDMKLNQLNQLIKIDPPTSLKLTNEEKYEYSYENQNGIYWGLGLENETYIEFESKAKFQGSFISNNITRERYSVNYLTNYKKKDIDILLKVFDSNSNYLITQMLNSHCFDKMDKKLNHKTTYAFKPLPNSLFSGKTLFDEWCEFDSDIIDKVSSSDKNNFNIFFDGDTIEFITENFYKAKIEDVIIELGSHKNFFIQKLQKFFLQKNLHPDRGTVIFPYINPGFNHFLSQRDGFVLFNNSTYHINITLPTNLLNGKILDNNKFISDHSRAISMIQWFEPLFICTLGSPDIFAVISDKLNLSSNLLYTRGSMRCALSRYIGVGTYNPIKMRTGRLLTSIIKDVKPENVIWWRDLIEKKLNYVLPDNQIGLDFNFNKHYQSGIEFRMLDGFPLIYLTSVIQSIVLMCAHSISISHIIDFASYNQTWNNLVYKSLIYGYNTMISDEEKEEIISKLKLKLNSKKVNSNKLEDFYFYILDELFIKYKNSDLVKSFCYEINESPKWNNFNKIQYEEHMNSLNKV